MLVVFMLIIDALLTTTLSDRDDARQVLCATNLTSGCRVRIFLSAAEQHLSMAATTLEAEMSCVSRSHLNQTSKGL